MGIDLERTKTQRKIYFSKLAGTQKKLAAMTELKRQYAKNVR